MCRGVRGLVPVRPRSCRLWAPKLASLENKPSSSSARLSINDVVECRGTGEGATQATCIGSYISLSKGRGSRHALPNTALRLRGRLVVVEVTTVMTCIGSYISLSKGRGSRPRASDTALRLRGRLVVVGNFPTVMQDVPLRYPQWAFIVPNPAKVMVWPTTTCSSCGAGGLVNRNRSAGTISTLRIPPWLSSGWGCRGRRLSRV